MPGVVRSNTGGMRVEVTLHLNDQQIRQALESAWDEANLALDTHFVAEFTANKWQWPYGKSPRDIIDDNILRSSYKGRRGAYTPARLEFLHRWATQYAVPVHEGYRTRNPDVVMPGRPWTKAPVGRLKRIFTAVAQRHLRNVR